MRQTKRCLFLLLLSIVLLTSCDDIKAVMSIVPKFDSKLPNIFAGWFALYEVTPSESDERYYFDSSDMTFEYHRTNEESYTGTYSYEYGQYIITEASGILKLSFDNGEKKEYEFYYSATAISGPDYLKIGDTEYKYVKRQK